MLGLRGHHDIGTGYRAVLTVVGCFQVRAYRKYAVSLIRPIDMSQTVEYRIAQWLRRNHPDERVFAIGTVSYWLNAFGDQQQVAGGFEHATPHRQNRRAVEEITHARTGEKGLIWLSAMGADLIVAGGPLTRAPFRRIEHPEKYQEVAEKVWSEGDDAIYRIPRRSRSLAHVVRRSDVLNLAEDRVEQFVAALEDRSLPLASFTWKNPHLAWIEAEMEPQQGLSVQVNFHSGWRASVDGRELAIERDGLGFMAIYPGCKGP